MPLSNKTSEPQKLSEAKAVISECRRDEGFHASTRNYPQFWNRDLVYSEGVLLDLGYAGEVRAQLSEFARLQRGDGQIPTSIALSDSKDSKPRFHSWTSDTEILFVIGMMTYRDVVNDSFYQQNTGHVALCVDFIERRLNGYGLIPGMDWRDAMPNYMGKFLLSNQMLLANMYESMGNHDQANRIKEKTNELFYSNELGFYADSVYWKGAKLIRDLHFDSLGNAMALLNHTSCAEAASGILDAFETAKTPFGYRNIGTPYEVHRLHAVSSAGGITAFVRNGAILRNRPNTYQNSTIWPFVEARVIDSLISYSANSQAASAASLMLERSGFNELYSPTSGEPQGSEGQLWTAASVVAAAKILNRK